MKIILLIIILMFFLFESVLVNSQSSITTTVEDIEDCDYRWFCSGWSPIECPENGVQKQKCTNAGDCPDDYQKPREKRGCIPELPKQLFDIKLELAHYTVYAPEDLAAWVRLESFGTEPTPINLIYIILDKQENVVYTKENYLVVETEEFVVERFEDLDLDPGKYSLLLKTLYNIDIEDEFRQDFEVKSKLRIWIYIITGFVIFGIVYGVVDLIIFMRKRKRKKKIVLKREIRKLKKKLKRKQRSRKMKGAKKK